MSDDQDIGYGFYVEFSNSSQFIKNAGLNYNFNSYNYITSNIFTPSKFTFNYTDIYTFKDFINGDSYVPLLHIRGKSLVTNNFTDGNFNFVIEPFVSYTPK